MADTIGVHASKVLSHNGAAAWDCDGAQVSALWRQLAIVVTVSGEVDAGNIDEIGKHIRRFALTGKPVVLDLSAVRAFPVQGAQCLYDLDEDCGAAGVEWALVAGPAVIDALTRHGDEVPTLASVPDALHHFADVIAMRRQLLMPLLRKTA